jgi:hypothetical protein
MVGATPPTRTGAHRRGQPNHGQKVVLLHLAPWGIISC